MEIHCLRLHPSQDLRLELRMFAEATGMSAGVILSAIGSLSQAALRFADRPEATLLPGPLELISLSGTLSTQGIHLHGAMADAQGQVFGGHIMDGCVIRTTAEVAIASLPSLQFSRAPDPQTGYLELVVEKLT